MDEQSVWSSEIYLSFQAVIRMADEAEHLVEIQEVEIQSETRDDDYGIVWVFQNFVKFTKICHYFTVCLLIIWSIN